MKIAIYGDSFGCETPIYETYHKNIEFLKTSWVSLLKENYQVTNFCEAGSDLYFSFCKFLQNYKNYDLNIFIKTSPYRLSVKDNKKYIHSHNIQSATAKLDKDKTNDKLKAIVSYFYYIQDLEKDEILSELYIEKIKSITTNYLILESFGETGLFNITLMENESWNFNPTYTGYDDFLDLRFCHMTKENNYILAQKITECIKTQKSFKLNLNDYIVPTDKEKDLYLIKK